MAAGDAATTAAGDEPRDAVLRAEGLTRQFGELTAVDDVDLAVEPGEFRSVIGPNGAGKTTLFDLLSGSLDPTGGRIYLEGEEITGVPPQDRVNRGLARSFQITDVFDGLTVRENVRLAVQSARYGSFSPAERMLGRTADLAAVNRRADEVVGRVGLAGDADASAAALAHGDRRRLEIGVVLAIDPEVVLLDEPTAGMSSDGTAETMELIREVLAEKTLLLVEHDVDLVMDVSDSITVLYRGEKLSEGTPAEIADDDDVQDAYLGGVER